MQIRGRQIGHCCDPFIIAEMSANHNGSYNRAVEIIYKARWAGVDAVKLQIFDPVRLAKRRGGIDHVVDDPLWAGRTLLDLYAEAETPKEWFIPLSYFHSCLFASVFDPLDIDYLETAADCPAYKIASREAGDVALVEAAAKTGKPIIISTGTATEDDLGASINAALKHTSSIALLYCVSDYPAKIIDLSQIETLRYRYGLPVGFSDHTIGIDAAIEAVKAGACIIEKHMTLRRAHGGLDAEFSLEPEEMRALVLGCYDAWYDRENGTVGHGIS